jgi:uncharacterized protein (TIGR03437 family)
MLLALAAGTTFAQTYPWDNSGNGLLKGTYYFRHVLWYVGDASGDLGEAIVAYGQITFDGNGNYTASAVSYDGYTGTLTSNYNPTGTYTIAANGYGFMDSPLASAFHGSTAAGDVVYGLVSNGIFTGSSTENQTFYNDMMIAAPLPSPAPTLSSLRGNYTLFALDMPGATPFDARDMQITMTADGNGNLTSVNASGYIGANGNTAIRQSLGSLKYVASNGAFNMHFGGSFTQSNLYTTLITGDQYMYISPDGNFIFGGSPTGWNMIVGIRNGSGTQNFSGLYYEAGMDQDLTYLSQQYGSTDSHYGSLKALGNNTLLGHQRIISTALFSQTSTNVYDSTFADGYTTNSDGSVDDSVQHYLFTNGGAVRIGVGLSPLLGISVAFGAPTFTAPGSAPYIDPTSITNTASSALFTSSVAPGELITFYGSNLAADSVQDATFPTTLDGVQVKFNGTPAPILSVNKCGPYPCVTVMAPYELAGSTVAQIQLFNKSVASNVVTAWVAILSDGTGGTAPGVFTFPAGGLGYAAAQHTTDFSLITPQNPAQPGEVIAVYLTGVGPVNPAVASGAPGPVPVANAVAALNVSIGGVAATTSFIGLTPQVTGLAQINLTVPNGLATGSSCTAGVCDYVFEVAGPDSDTFQALISVHSGAASSGRSVTGPSPRARMHRAGAMKAVTTPERSPGKLLKPAEEMKARRFSSFGRRQP